MALVHQSLDIAMFGENPFAGANNGDISSEIGIGIKCDIRFVQLELSKPFCEPIGKTDQNMSNTTNLCQS